MIASLRITPKEAPTADGSRGMETTQHKGTQIQHKTMTWASVTSPFPRYDDSSNTHSKDTFKYTDGIPISGWDAVRDGSPEFGFALCSSSEIAPEKVTADGDTGMTNRRKSSVPAEKSDHPVSFEDPGSTGGTVPLPDSKSEAAPAESAPGGHRIMHSEEAEA